MHPRRNATSGQSPARAVGQRDATGLVSQRLPGTAMDARTCAAAGRWNFGSHPMVIPRQVVIGWRFTDGHFSVAPLQDLHLIAYAEIPCYAFQGSWTIGVYLDEHADLREAGEIPFHLSHGSGAFALGIM